MKREFTEAIRVLAGTHLVDKVYLVDCNVNSVDRTKLTCDCTPIGGNATTLLPGVLLMAENSDGLVVFPKVDSSVKVAFSTRTDPFIIQWSEIDEVEIYIEGLNPGDKPTKYNIKAGSQQFNDGSYGGLPLVMGLLNKINRLENTFNTHIHPVSGSATSTPTVLITPVTLQSDIENPLITHGK